MKWLVILFFVFFSCCKDDLNKVGQRRGEQIPAIDLLLLDSISIINTANLKAGNSVVLFFFDPTCPHCQVETKSILSKLSLFKSTEICFISIASLEDVRWFQKKFKIDEKENIHLGIDTALTYVNFFGVKSVPHNTVYSSDKKLVAVFPYGTDADQLLSVIK
ncbi:redoxin domain-containing protein [Chitinophaga oryzae]|uniref:Redoxin domain-containing protein n=1 Tax=Chitinophaga oryzae TaxID=2725414 RepID=A0AAE7D8Z0_9BACT|nr:redoxin domain-containing protein [Chitinophaga oryzae]